MDQTNNLAPLFEAQLVLEEPVMIFIPSLETETADGFNALINGLISDIIKISSFMPRLTVKPLTYEQEIEANCDIAEMKSEIFSNVEQVIREANEFCHNFQSYSYLWLDDRTVFLKQFLSYGRPLSQEEIDLVQAKDSLAPQLNPPKMESFREQVA